MAAGLGFKDFTTGEVLTAADVDGYLMQGVWVFASAAARDAAVTSPQEGNFAYLKDTNVTTYYTGSAWANLDTTGMTNPMTTTGDTIYSSSGSTPARLGIGTAGQVLTVNSGATAPEWAAPATGGGLVLISTTSFSGVSSQSFNNVFTSTYDNYKVIFFGTQSASGIDTSMRLRASSSDNTTSNYKWRQNYYGTNNTTFTGGSENAANYWRIGFVQSTDSYMEFEVFMPQLARYTWYRSNASGGGNDVTRIMGRFAASTQFDGFSIIPDSGNITGTVSIYGYAK